MAEAAVAAVVEEAAVAAVAEEGAGSRKGGRPKLISQARCEIKNHIQKNEIKKHHHRLLADTSRLSISPIIELS